MFAATILPAAAQTAGVDRVEPDLGAAVKQYCVACHNSRALIGNLALDEVESDAASLGANAELSEPRTTPASPSRSARFIRGRAGHTGPRVSRWSWPPGAGG